jgi:hypothetical protein
MEIRTEVLEAILCFQPSRLRVGVGEVLTTLQRVLTEGQVEVAAVLEVLDLEVLGIPRQHHHHKEITAGHLWQSTPIRAGEGEVLQQ